MVGIAGRITTGNYQAEDGSTRYTFDVVADNVKFLTSKKEESESSNSVSSIESSEIVLSDDDLPF